MKEPSSGRQRLCVYNGGFLTGGRLKRILELAGWDVSVGVPGPDDWVGVWGRTPTAWRGEAVAGWTEAPLLTVEDAFLRSVHPNRLRPSSPLGLCLDRSGVHFDASAPSDLETLLRTHPLDDTVLLDRARDAIDSLTYWHLGKYSATDPTIAPPPPGYVVLIDQTEGDAALQGAGRAAFLEMLAHALDEHPGQPVYIKTHPETAGGARGGHFRAEDLSDRVQMIDAPISPWRLFEGAVAVYTHSSSLGFEAIFAGLKPRVFGAPFYAGWGLTQDEADLPRRDRKLTRAQIFAAAMILYPVWFDPLTDALCEVETVIATLAAEARAWREDRDGYAISGVSRWKRPWLKAALGRETRIRFGRARGGEQSLVWGMAEAPEGAARMEDGFLRSRGLGAALTPPLSIAIDRSGMYYDPSRPSHLDELCSAAHHLPPGEIRRAEALIGTLRAKGITKYNAHSETPALGPDGRTILVVGQVEDDASMRLGAPGLGNLDLLRRAREANPDTRILWKPHPDVEGGYRAGQVAERDLEGLADHALLNVGAAEALSLVDEVWTLTSTLGFEALLRGKPVTCLGMPFYAGRGLTTDLALRPTHRSRDLSLAQLAHACLIGYPRYFDPRNGQPISPEAAVNLLAHEDSLPQAGSTAGLIQRLYARLVHR